MDDSCCKIMSQLSEVRVEPQGTTAMFQSLSPAQGRVYKCDMLGEVDRTVHSFRIATKLYRHAES